MAEPSLALQMFLRDRLISDDDLMALLPSEEYIMDRSGRPEVHPCVNIGDGQSVFEDFFVVVHADLHVWVEEDGLTGAKEIGGAIIAALEDCPWIIPGWFVSDLSIKSARYLRDPSGKFSHGILSYAAVMKQRAAA